IKAGGAVEFFVDEMGGKPIARLEVTNTDEKKVLQANLQKEISGVHDLYIIFRDMDGEMFDFDWWCLE
ncbi:MAG: glycoside hydrolase, partial [Bacteroides sp.]|nr:glycoside hydrolase [Bacteroides sp.]